MSLTSRSYGLFFRLCRGLIRCVYPQYKIQDLAATDPDETVVYIAHHQNLFGPFLVLLWYPRILRVWMLHVFLSQPACYDQYVNYTFSKRFGWNRTIAKLVAYPLSFGISKLMQSGRGIPVYRGSRKIVNTFQISVEALKNGERIAIFPDVDYTDSSPNTKALYEGFLHLDKYYYRQTNRHISFIPLYVSKHKKTIYTKQKIRFRDGIPFDDEKDYVINQIQQELNRLAEAAGEF